MDYLELKINLPKEKVDLVSAFLIGEGFDTFEVCDYSDLMESAGEMFYDYIEDDLLEKQNTPPCLKFYCEVGEEKPKKIRAFIEKLAEEKGWSDVSAEETLVTGSDWDTKWKEFFYPFPVGEKLYINPKWEEIDPVKAGDRGVILIDPAAAFGTGTHATTHLCLEGLEKVIRGGETVLDMGCGSGILGIAAVRLGAERIVGVDIDEAACRCAEENFSENGISREKFTILCGDVLSDPAFREKVGAPFHLIAANIVAGIITQMAPYLYSVLKPGGKMIASGILSAREEEVKTALLAAGFRLISSDSEEDWVSLTLEK